MSSPSAECTLTARWIFPVSAAPVAEGTITLGGERIVAVDPPGVRKADINLGNAALLPGLVNAHTHLDLSGLRNRTLPTPDFTAWLRTVIRHRRQQTPAQIEADIQAGVHECLRFGTTLVGDISAGGQSWPILAAGSVRAVVFHELLGLPQDRALRAGTIARDWLATHSATPSCCPGLSPHAPFSVRSTLFDDAARLARSVGCPLAVHLAETLSELELLESRRGPFLDFLRDLDVWDPEGLAADPEEVIERCRPAPRLLLIHGNYLDPDVPLPADSTVVYCPRTHAAFGHRRQPFRDFLARGIRVALGTDSLASNPDLDVLAEARFIHRHYPEVEPATILRMATLSGAEALGWSHETGSLSPGKSADLIVVPLPNTQSADPLNLVLESALGVQRVMCRGQWTVPHLPAT